MAGWFLPAVKAIVPYISPIIAAAMPVFTSRKGNEAAANQAGLAQRQIAELQSAVSRNASHIKELAEQLQKTVTVLEQGAAVAEARVTKAMRLCIAAVVVSLVAAGISCIALFGR